MSGPTASQDPTPQDFSGQILDNLLEGCQLIGFDWRYLYVNRSVCRQGRKGREELLGRTMMEVYPGIENSPVFAAIRRCMEERTPSRLENEFTFPDGTSDWFELRIEPVPRGVVVLSVDLAARKLAERAVERHLRRLRSLRTIDLAILGTTDLQLALRTVVDEASRQLELDVVAVMLVEPGSIELECVADRGFLHPQANRMSLRLGSGIPGRAALERRTLVVPDLRSAAASDLPEAWRSEQLEALAAVPLIAKGDLLGVVVVGQRGALEASADWLEFLESLAGQAAMGVESVRSFGELRRANLELRLSYETTIEGWSRVMDLRDKDTEGHTLRVAEITLRLAQAAGLSDHELVHVRHGALLHDIGKIGIPDSILLKPGPLDEEEWEVMRRHPTYAYDLLSPIPYLRPALDIPWCHHERWDGSGYPRGLRGEQIPAAARLFAVVDVWDALRSDRPYRSAWPEQKVRQHLREGSGSHFEPRAVDLFLEVFPEEPPGAKGFQG